MKRLFLDKNIELLAPAGTFNDFKEIINSSADAVYFGGKAFNMRMHRKDYNLTNEEIEKAVLIAHSLEKKVYITFNNMMSDNELEDSRNFLTFLSNIKVDGLIIQDLGAVKLINEMNINIPLHSSVMMNVHNKQMIDDLYKKGITRVVTSREMNIETIKRLSKETPMEFEYFVHGDMCVTHGAQCMYSGLLFGKSGSRGLCLKPCRWPFKAESGSKEEYNYPLAVKDMCMYEHLPELIQSGVCSFKIEGRMKGSKYLVQLINTYGKAIDRYIEDPAGYYPEDVIKELEENKTRNLSTGYAFKIPGSSNIDIEGKREPRIFSNAAEESYIDDNKIRSLKSILKSENLIHKSPLLSVKVNNLEALKAAANNGANEIYIAGDVFRNDRPFNKEDIKAAVNYAEGKNVYITLPKMMYDRHFNELNKLMDFYLQVGIKGFVVTNLGAASELKDKNFNLIGDYSLNCYNSKAIDFYNETGIERMTASIEAPAKVLKDMLIKSKTDIEIIVQGAPTVMYLEHCLYAAKKNLTSKDWCPRYCEEEAENLIDEKGFKHPVYADQFCRNHILPVKDICLIDIVYELKNLGAAAIRIEGQHYTPEILGNVVSVYRAVLDNLNTVNALNKINLLEKLDDNIANINIDKSKNMSEILKNITNRGQSLQSLSFDMEA